MGAYGIGPYGTGEVIWALQDLVEFPAVFNGTQVCISPTDAVDEMEYMVRLFERDCPELLMMPAPNFVYHVLHFEQPPRIEPLFGAVMYEFELDECPEVVEKEIALLDCGVELKEFFAAIEHLLEAEEEERALAAMEE